jgi:hypothetical protein
MTADLIPCSVRSACMARARTRHFCAAWIMTLLLTLTPVWAGSLKNDPNGFHGIHWGASLAERTDLTLADPGDRVKGYDLREGGSQFGDASVELMRFVTIEDRFARVTIRYKGKTNHDKVLAYLQSTFGMLDRTPGQMVRGLNQQYNWRGDETEINLTYEAQRDQGYLFFESRELAPRFNDVLPDAAY